MTIRATLPDGFGLIDDPEEFEEIAGFSGIEPEFHFRIFRFRRGDSE